MSLLNTHAARVQVLEWYVARCELFTSGKLLLERGSDGQPHNVGGNYELEVRVDTPAGNFRSEWVGWVNVNTDGQVLVTGFTGGHVQAMKLAVVVTDEQRDAIMAVQP